MSYLLDRILRSISQEPLENIDKTAKALAREAGADGYMVAVEDGGSLNVLTTGGGFVKAVSGVMERAKAERQIVAVTGRTRDRVAAAMCVPLIVFRNPVEYENEKRQATDIHDPIKGYIYFQSTQGDISFSPESSKELRGILSLLSSFIEHHQSLLIAGTDKLTGALNRKFTDAALESLFKQAAKNGASLSVIMTDLDFFKQVNDTYGHLAGDDVLRETSSIIRRQLGKGDVLGRYGGEEFIIMLNDSDSFDARAAAEAIRAAIPAANILGDKREITTSMGIATYPEHAASVKELVEKADKALYAAKQTGRNKYEVWNESMDELVVVKDSRQLFFTGESIKDVARLQALYKIMGVLKLEAEMPDKINMALDEIQSAIGSSDITFFMTDGEDKVTGAHRMTTPDRKPPPYNDSVIQNVIETHKSLFFVDWDNDQINLSEGIAEWQSIIVVPAVCLGKLRGILYAGVPVRQKEFTADEMVFMQYSAVIVASMLR